MDIDNIFVDNDSAANQSATINWSVSFITMRDYHSKEETLSILVNYI